ncbi:MAG: hypothetical protein IPK83_00330 [Planctomycetes bacterium]|nr:hypothetical protein [Planctomycetota bacterium]
MAKARNTAHGTMSRMEFDPNVLPVPDLGLCCMQCGYALRGLPSHRCPECGREFTLNEYIPRGDFPVVIRHGRGSCA